MNTLINYINFLVIAPFILLLYESVKNKVTNKKDDKGVSFFGIILSCCLGIAIVNYIPDNVSEESIVTTIVILLFLYGLYSAIIHKNTFYVRATTVLSIVIVIYIFARYFMV